MWALGGEFFRDLHSSLSKDGPREDPKNGFASFAEWGQGDKMRVRAASFADHFSQARQFFYSLTEPEQNHLIAAFTSNLSKVEMKAIRTRMLSQLANVDMRVAQRVANNLGDQAPIVHAPSAKQARTDLKPSRALSILAKAKPTLKGRTIGCLVADGTDAAMVAALKTAAKQQGALVKIIAVRVEGVKDTDGKMIPADFQLAGGPSVLFDAVVLAISSEGAQQLTQQASAIGFVGCILTSQGNWT